MFKTLYYTRKIILTLFVATFLLAFGAAVTSVYTLERYESVSSAPTQNEAIIKDTYSDSAVGYFVKEYNGIIGVYDFSNELMYTVEVYVKTLPAKDREMLKEGIYADSYGEILEILGDYTA